MEALAIYSWCRQIPVHFTLLKIQILAFRKLKTKHQHVTNDYYTGHSKIQKIMESFLFKKILIKEANGKFKLKETNSIPFSKKWIFCNTLRTSINHRELVKGKGKIPNDSVDLSEISATVTEKLGASISQNCINASC